MERDMRSPENNFYQHRMDSDFNKNMRVLNSRSKKSPEAKSIKQFRSNSPNIRFNPNNSKQTENHMDKYKLKKMDDVSKLRK